MIGKEAELYLSFSSALVPFWAYSSTAKMETIFFRNVG
jgi:hypothetical protein